MVVRVLKFYCRDPQKEREKKVSWSEITCRLIKLVEKSEYGSSKFNFSSVWENTQS